MCCIKYSNIGKKSLSVAVVDEFYTFDLMEVNTCKEYVDLDLEFQSQDIFFLVLYSTHITKES